MSGRVAVETACLRLRGDLQERYLPLAERDQADRTGQPVATFRGRGREFVVEAQTRKWLIDPMLRALGWNVDDPRAILVENGVEPRLDEEGARRFLDYHGRSMTSGSQQSLLLVEAKRLSATLPPSKHENPEQPFLDALERLRSGRRTERRFPAEWAEWLKTLNDYLRRLRDRPCGVPLRAAITNGLWWVVFPNPAALIAEEAIASGDVEVFQDLDHVRAGSIKFADRLGYGPLSGDIPEQHPSGLINLLTDVGHAQFAAAVVVSQTSHAGVEPVVALRVVALLCTNGGRWIRFAKNMGSNFVNLHQEAEDLQRCHARLDETFERMRRDLEAIAPVRWLTQTEIESFSIEAGLCRAHAEGHLLLTGGRPTFLADDETFDDCPFHDYGACMRDGNGASSGTIMYPSVTPRSFFPGGSTHHCAHATIETLKRNRCILQGIDDRLCCHRCAFFARCWMGQEAHMPCMADRPARS